MKGTTPDENAADPARRSILKRKRRTRTQTHLDALRRSGNVGNAFALKGGNLPCVHHILIVDDVFTTGATVGACHKVLREAFGPDVRISAATLSCTTLY